MIRIPIESPIRTVKRAQRNAIARTEKKLGRSMTASELILASEFYAAGKEDRSDELQPAITETELKLAHYQSSTRN